MLPTLGPPPGDIGWAVEFKWDGARAVAYTGGGQVRLVSRGQHDCTGSYPEVTEVGRLLGNRRAVLDGEIVALTPSGAPSFSRLQRRMNVSAPKSALISAVPVVYVVFDVLFLDSASTTRLPYGQRRELLDDLALTGEAVWTTDTYVDVDPALLLATANAAGMEGIVAKRLTSRYEPGRRSSQWIKSPVARTQEVVIVGYTAGRGRRTGTIGSLLLGSHNGPQLRYVGQVGTGFTAAMLHDLARRLAPLARSTPATAVPTEDARGAVWVAPTLVGEVTFRSWTTRGRLRHPSWRGLRPDRQPIEARTGPPQHGPFAQSTVHIDGAMCSDDGRWRVEVVRNAHHRWYRICHDDNIIDWLTLADVERTLGKAGVDIRLLREAA
ncbi:non-homologous end-joining DNA ligase [Polymorphospora sp. NPDC050346]|uniref:non-homologous end-joining DNA ligase n=1 Tax=Polymorphospora sp. NPDC050346 TaxID=3155780 RepID=UPI00340A37CF